MTHLEPTPEPPPPLDLETRTQILEALDDAVEHYQDAHLSPASKRAYASSINTYADWCRQLGLTAYVATPETIARYISYRAQHGKKVSTIHRDLAAISYLHVFGPDPDAPDPTTAPHVTRTMRGLRREHHARTDKKRALTPRDIVKMVDSLDPHTPAGARDRAILMFGFASSLRRSELAALDRSHLEDDPHGIRVLIPDSKGDQDSEGQLVGVAFGPTPDLCPVTALRTWLATSPYQVGPVFRPIDRHGNIGRTGLSGDAIAAILKRHATAAGLEAETVAGHSLRAGHATSAATAGEDIVRIQRTLRHRKLDTTAGYIRTARVVLDSSSHHLWDDIAATRNTEPDTPPRAGGDG